MKRKFLCTILLMGYLFASYAQDQFLTLSGKVSDKETKKPLPGAHVQIEGTFYATVTNIDGQFSFRNLKSGIYVLKVSYLGFISAEIEVNTDNTSFLAIDLSSSAITTEEVIITATRADSWTPGTKQTISGEKIREISTGQDLPLLLDLTPSIVTTTDAGIGTGYTGLRIRGTDISRINVTINGVPLNDPESQSVFWVNMPDLAGSVDNIQIQRGVGTSANGAAAFGASINIQTVKLITEPFAEISSHAGSYNSFSNSIRYGTGLINGKWTFDGRLSRISSDGYIDRAFSDLKSHYLNAAYFSEKNIIRFTMMSGNERTYLAWSGVPKDSLQTNRTFNPHTYENETDNYHQNHYHLNFMRQHNQKLSLNAMAFLITGKGFYEQMKENQKLSKYGIQPQIIGNDTISKSDIVQQKHLDNIFYGINLAGHYNSMKKLKLSAGLSLNHYQNDHFGKIIWMQYAATIPKDFQWYLNKGDKTDFSGFLKGNYLLTEKINVFGDLLYRNISYEMDGIHDDLRNLTQTHRFSFFNPKGGVYVMIDSHQECYVYAGVAHREPSRNNFRDADENTEIKPELLIDYEAGYNVRFKNLLLNSNIYFMDYRDQLVLTGEINNVGDPIMVNVPNSYRAGIELLASVKITSKLDLDANLNLSRNKIRDFTEYVDDWDTWNQISNYLGETDISFSPAIVGGAELVYKPFRFLKVTLATKYVGKQYIDNTSSEERILNPWFVNNLRFSCRIPGSLWKNAEIRFSVNNIFNEMYESNAWVYRYYSGGEEFSIDGYFPQAGRHYMIGLSITF
jgi:iron complex outermembrane recepter protein